MTFDPDAHVQAAREHYIELAKSPAFRDHAIHQLQSMAQEEHGMWAPLADLVKELQPLGPARLERVKR